MDTLRTASMTSQPWAGSRTLGSRHDQLPRRLSLHRRVPRRSSDLAADLPLPHVRAAAAGRARHRGAAAPQPGRVDAPLRRSLQAHRVAVRLGRLGQEGVDLSRDPRRERRLDGRGRHQHLLGRALRHDDRRRGSLGQAVRQLAHRVVQGSRHDGARLGRQADDRRRPRHQRRRVRLDRRHVGGARRLRGGGGDSGDRHPAARARLAGAARAAARQRRARARARHRLRRLHGDRAAPRRRRNASTSPTR